MTAENLLNHYKKGINYARLLAFLEADKNVLLEGLKGSSKAVFATVIIEHFTNQHLFIISSQEQAAYFYNDLQYLLDEIGLEIQKQSIFFFPTSYKNNQHPDSQDSTNLLMRIEALKHLQKKEKKYIIVTYPEALVEKVVSTKTFVKNRISLKIGTSYSMDKLEDQLIESSFKGVEFVYEPGQFAVRGGIMDIFSYTDDYPFRIEFFDDEIESIRAFNPIDQLSIKQFKQIAIIPNILDIHKKTDRLSFLQYIPNNTTVWLEKAHLLAEQLANEYSILRKNTDNSATYISQDELIQQLVDLRIVEYGNKACYTKKGEHLIFKTKIQVPIQRRFETLQELLKENDRQELSNYILTPMDRQKVRIKNILTDINPSIQTPFQLLSISLHEGFIDTEQRCSVFVDHQLFGRYHKFQLKKQFSNKEALSLKALSDLKPGDYVTHIDYGIGKFGGLEKVFSNGKEQESIRLIYNEGDMLYVSIHSLHRISKYTVKEGKPPKIHRLGSKVWQATKAKTKKKIKDIAKDLIDLYARRKASKGMAFSPDTYLQTELEASFIYEDTPDQYAATQSVKEDMEKPFPMDRLVCGDVGFGKTEVAIRAAFKAVADNKQVAVLVPTTILALQHGKSFADRLKEMPCRVDYINRFRTSKEQTQIKKDLKAGKIDILIGTHRLLSKDIEFKDLGLIVIDEEQKFGVAMKERLKKMKVNVDTLTLTATPIPRTLQFSLMGARDLSIINTAPPNRYPIQTDLNSFGEEVIKTAIRYELNRGGQVFFVHNRVQNIGEVAAIIKKFVPEAEIGIGHGQMEGRKLEKLMMEFINGKFDVLVATTIIESGLDIPNANTIIINDAQNYGLSALHQLRGRVGRSNKKAFCYLLTPPLASLPSEAQKRMRAIEEFSDLGSGFNIAMRDLDIRGAGDVLGAEQSGFITDIGYETYQKILDEAITELKETEYKELYKEELKKKDFVKECQIDTDMSILIPDEYIEDIGERLRIYKELDNLKNDMELEDYILKLKDRFGKIPQQTKELFNTLKIRWIAQKLGIEKVILKKDQMICYFVKNRESDFYDSELFMKILFFIQQHSGQLTIKERNGKLNLLFYKVRDTQKALRYFEEIHAGIQE